MDAQADLSLFWLDKSNCRFYCVLAHILHRCVNIIRLFASSSPDKNNFLNK